MKKIILYNPAISTLNLGDEIIFDSINTILAPLLEYNFVINVSTHLPVSRFYSKLICSADEKFVCGTNLLRNYFSWNFRQWDINIFNVNYLSPCVLIGVGWQNDSCRLSPYTAHLYKKILDKEKLHSVRDNHTKKRLEELGFKNVVNTACPTMWGLTKEFCNDIPKGKAKEVVFTFTDYNIDREKDSFIVNELKKAYDNVYVWPQSIEDFKYAKSLDLLGEIEFIDPSLKAYDSFLSSHDVDYIGTRLHGGIRALQHKKRTMILAVDSRAIAKKSDFNLPVLERKHINSASLLSAIYSDRITNIVIPEKEIITWKKTYGLL